MCIYCPQDILLKAYRDEKKIMSFEDFKQIMLNVQKDVGIDFSGLSEAFFNSEASLMMKYCIQKRYSTHLYTTLKGFTQNDAMVLRGLTFDDVFFHKFSSKNFNLQEFEENRILFEKNIKSKGIFRLAIINQSGKPGSVGLPLWSRAGNLSERPNIKGAVYCSSTPEEESFNHNVVLPNGDVYICCMDYGLKHKIGNLLETKYDDLDRISIRNLSNKGMSDLLCRKCELCVERYAIKIPGLS